MNPSEIAQTLDQVEKLRRDTRRTLQSFSFPMVLFGALTLLSAPLFLIGDGGAVALFWALAGPAGGVATGVHYARREQTLGLSRCATPYIVVAVGIMAGAFLLPALTSGDLRDVVSNLAVAVGYLAFAVIERDGRIAGIAAVMAAVPLVLLALAPGLAGPVTAAVTGLILTASGLAFRRTQTAAGRTR